MRQQPTEFTLTTYTLSEVFDTPELITSLANYSELRQSLSSPDRSRNHHRVTSDSDSVLFLQVFAAADYFTTNKTLMRNVPPVNVDISELDFIFGSNRSNLTVLTVLDPFLFNILPRSLLPTGVYLSILAVFAWYLSNYISCSLFEIARTRPEQDATLNTSEAGQRSKKVN